jgi:hypothetical protein
VTEQLGLGLVWHKFVTRYTLVEENYAVGVSCCLV